MVYSLAYRRPSYVTSSRNSSEKSLDESIDSCSSCLSGGIPPALSFDRIVEGGTCPPVTVREFLNYLKYIEHAAENLQFFLWYRDFTIRWQRLPDAERALAPEWTQAQADAEAAAAAATSRTKNVSPHVVAILKGTDFADPSTITVSHKQFSIPAKSQSFEDNKLDSHSEDGSSLSDHHTLLSSNSAHVCTADQAFDDAGVKWQPFSAQPYRDEISRIIGIYLAEGSPRELNLSSRQRQAVLHALQHTTHPSAFRSIISTVEYSLRRQAHPNFIRWTICNGNPPRVIFAHGLGIFLIVAAFLADLLITLSHAGRAWRVLPFPGWFLGIATLIAATKGMCVVLHGLHHRHLQPWELFADEKDPAACDDEKIAGSNSSLLSSSANSFEEEPWIPRYKKRNYIRKIFDRQIWIQEPALRQIQDTIFLQSILGAFLTSAIAVGVFCAVPHGNLY